MAYLNCPFCPAQAYPAPRTETFILVGMGMQRWRCDSKHTFYVRVEDFDGINSTVTDGSV